jgi:hypothetical protein
LWAIRVDEAGLDEASDLFTPAINAAVALALWKASGNSFGWHPAWISGAALNIRPAIRLHVVGGGRRKGPLSAMSFATQVHGMVARAEALARNVDMGMVPDG